MEEGERGFGCARRLGVVVQMDRSRQLQRTTTRNTRRGRRNDPWAPEFWGWRSRRREDLAGGSNGRLAITCCGPGLMMMMLMMLVCGLLLGAWVIDRRLDRETCIESIGRSVGRQS